MAALRSGSHDVRADGKSPGAPRFEHLISRQDRLLAIPPLRMRAWSDCCAGSGVMLVANMLAWRAGARSNGLSTRLVWHECHSVGLLPSNR